MCDSCLGTSEPRYIKSLFVACICHWYQLPSVWVIGAWNFANTIQINYCKSIIMTEAWRLQSDIDNWQLCWKYLVEFLWISTGLWVICFLQCRQIRSCNTHIYLVSMLDSFVCHQPSNKISTMDCAMQHGLICQSPNHILAINLRFLIIWNSRWNTNPVSLPSFTACWQKKWSMS